MIEPDLSLAPGCFGLALTYSDKAPECASCPFRLRCAPAAAARVLLLREKFGIEMPVKTRKSVRAKEPGKRRVAKVPERVAIWLEQIETNGIAVAESLRNNRNPFDTRLKELNLVSHALLRRPDGITRGLLMEVLMRALGINEGAARIYLAHSLQVLSTLEAITEASDTIHIRKAA